MNATDELIRQIDGRTAEIKSMQIAATRGGSSQRRNHSFRLFGAAVRAHMARQSLDTYALGLPQSEADQIRAARQALNEPNTIKSVANPAATTVAGWAAELVGTRRAPFVMLTPNSAWAQLYSRPSTISLEFGRDLQIAVPGYSAASAGKLAGDWHQEGEPIVVRKSALSATMLEACHLAVISTFTAEMAKSSNFEEICRAIITADTGQFLDTALLDEDYLTPFRPNGLLAANPAIPASTATGKADAIAEDISSLIDAIINPADLVFISRADLKARAAIYAPGTAGLNWITTPGCAAKRLIALDAACLAMAGGDLSFDVVSEATIVNQDMQPIDDVLASSTQSLWQMDAYGLRLFSAVSWGMNSGDGKIAHINSVSW